MKEKNILEKIKEYRKNKKEIALKKAEENKPQTFGEVVLSWVKSLGFALLFVMILQSLLMGSFVVPTGSMENTVMTGDFLIVNKKFGPSTPQIIPFVEIPLPYILFPTPFDPKRGDVIVFIYQGGRDEIKPRDFTYYLKRCVAIPGDTLLIVDNQLYINGELQVFPSEGLAAQNIYRDNSSEVFRTFPVNKRFTNSNYGPIRIPKKGDTIHFNTSADFQNFRIFIEREGYQANWLGDKALINNQTTNFYVVEQNYYFGIGDNRDNSSDSREWGFIPRKAILGSPIFCWLSWEMYDEYGNERNIFGKFANIRWSRIGRGIN